MSTNPNPLRDGPILPDQICRQIDRLCGRSWRARPASELAFSESSVWCIELPADSFSSGFESTKGLATGSEHLWRPAFAIKRSPSESADKLRSIHRYLQWLTRQPGLDLVSVGPIRRSIVPRLIAWPIPSSDQTPTLLVVAAPHRDAALEGSCWEWIEWRDGQPLPSIDDVNANQLTAVARTLGTLHRVSREWSPYSNQSPSSGDHRFQQRVDRLKLGIQTRFRLQQEAIESLTRTTPGALCELLGRGLSLAIEQAPLLESPLMELHRQNKDSHWCHGDAWRGNWLFRGRELVGLIDFAQADVYWPGFDVARAFGSMIAPRGRGKSSSNSDSQSTKWEEAWDSYRHAHPNSELNLDEIRLMHRVSTLLSLVNYIDQAGRAPLDSLPTAWLGRVDEITEHLEAMATE